jgi:hypothetical protein
MVFLNASEQFILLIALLSPLLGVYQVADFSSHLSMLTFLDSIGYSPVFFTYSMDQEPMSAGSSFPLLNPKPKSKPGLSMKPALAG